MLSLFDDIQCDLMQFNPSNLSTDNPAAHPRRGGLGSFISPEVGGGGGGWDSRREEEEDKVGVSDRGCWKETPSGKGGGGNNKNKNYRRRWNK